jgi:hypothetical protein
MPGMMCGSMPGMMKTPETMFAAIIVKLKAAIKRAAKPSTASILVLITSPNVVSILASNKYKRGS